MSSSPPTVAENDWLPFVGTVADVGAMETITGFIVKVAEEDTVGSALLVAVTVQVVATATEDGAVYITELGLPEVASGETEPQPLAGLTDQVTAVFIVPSTAAEND